MSTRARSTPGSRPTVASIPSVAYLKAANRFLGLSLAAAERDEDDEGARAEEEPETAAEDEPEEEPKERKGKKAKKGKVNEPCADEEDGDGDEDRAAEEEDDDEDKEDDKKKGAAKARAAERARWAAVLSSEEAKGRVALACLLLADTDMTEDKIRSALLAAPTEGRQGLAARMATVPRPDVGSGPASGTQPDATSARVAEMKKAYDLALGR